MYAYTIPWIDGQEGRPGVESGQEALAADPRSRRLLIAGPWALTKWHGPGAIAIWRGASKNAEDYLAPVPTEDGMQYLGSKVQLTASALAKAEACPDVTVKLACGQELSIALATSGGRKRIFASKAAIGAPVEDFHRLAVAICDRIDAQTAVPLDDPDFAQLLYLAIARRYRVTAEALDQWGIITTSDDAPIFKALTGSSPKAGAAAGAT